MWCLGDSNCMGAWQNSTESSLLHISRSSKPVGRIRGKLLTMPDIREGYERVFENLRLYSSASFLGVSMQQNPNDALVLGDLLWRLQPDLLIELGTSGGGSAVFFAHIMARYNPQARVLTMDPGSFFGSPLRQWNEPDVWLICPHCLHASRTPEWRSGAIRFVHAIPDSEEALAIAQDAVAKAKVVMVIDDSDHSKETVRKNLAAYSQFVTPGSYFVVQDTRIGGPLQAVRLFLDTDAGRSFCIDRRFEYFIYSQHFDGFLRRRKGGRDTCGKPDGNR